MPSEFEWMRSTCRHDWRTGPMVDRLIRHRPAVCTKCWEYWGNMPYAESVDWPEWTADDYEAHKDTVERIFFS
jgi:hypothetical protein